MEPQTTSISKSSLLLAVLILGAAVMGYLLYQKMGLKINQPPVVGLGKGTEPTSEERAVLNYPGADVSEAEWTNFLVLVAKLAVETNTITIGADCSVSPVVTKTPLVAGKKFTLRNTDSVPHTISFNNPPNYTVPAGGTAQLPVDFGGIPGIYGYGCDNSPTPVGLIQVLQ